jgi:hypothetical protein
MKATPLAKGKDLDAFRASHDRSFMVPKKITAGLTSLGDSWEYEAEFIKRCGLSTTDFAAYRDAFIPDHCVDTPGSGKKRVWAGTKGFANKLRAQVK